MEMRSTFLGFMAGLMLGTPAWAQQWFAVSGPNAGAGETVVEIDLDTVRIRSNGGESVVRVSFVAPQRHGGGFDYLSVVATAQLDCTKRSIRLTSAAYYALPASQGQRMGSDSSGHASGMPPDLLEKIPVPARQAILKATCTPAHN